MMGPHLLGAVPPSGAVDAPGAVLSAVALQHFDTFCGFWRLKQKKMKGTSHILESDMLKTTLVFSFPSMLGG